MKRLYAKAHAVDTSQGFAIELDGRPVRTPGRRPLLLPASALAEAIAGEWREQGGNVRPETMPLTQLAATVIDALRGDRAAIEAAVMRFAETDLICYRADEPPGLVRLQRAQWDPLLDWLAENYGIRLAVTAGVLPIAQPADAIAGLARFVRAMDDWQFGAFQAAAAASGSFVIALALTDARIDADEAFAAAELDESFEIEKWGEDDLAAKRRAVVAADLSAARRFRDLLGDRP